jgi:hypothetical protein
MNYRITRRYVIEGIHSYHCENLKSHNILSCWATEKELIYRELIPYNRADGSTLRNSAWYNIFLHATLFCDKQIFSSTLQDGGACFTPIQIKRISKIFMYRKFTFLDRKWEENLFLISSFRYFLMIVRKILYLFIHFIWHLFNSTFTQIQEYKT